MTDVVNGRFKPKVNGSSCCMENGNGLSSAGDHGSNGWETGVWSVGFLNSASNYLTAETFGFKTNSNGSSLKKKQTWTLEGGEHGDHVTLRSHLGRYLAVDSFGNVTCEGEERDAGSFYEIQLVQGGWALKNVSRGYYLGSCSDKLTCTAKSPSPTEIWSVHLCARPQVNLRSVGRKRFARLSEDSDEVVVDSNVAWGADTLFTLQFRQGRYALHTPNNKFLGKDGKLLDTVDTSCLFTVEFHRGQLALRDEAGLYLAPIGSKAVLKSRSSTITKDELFYLQDSLPQAGFVAALNSRFLSVKQGIDLTANQEEISNDELFQLEFEPSLRRWYLRTMKDKYWSVETQGGIQASLQTKTSNGLFDLIWNPDGSMGFRANNGKFLGAKRSGHLYANCEQTDDQAKFYFHLVNRPRLVLRCEQGFLGFKSPTVPRLECNKASYETIQVERGDAGRVTLKMGGKFCVVRGDGAEIVADGETGTKFIIELKEPNRLAIRTETGQCLNALKNGQVGLGGTGPNEGTQWEF